MQREKQIYKFISFLQEGLNLVGILKPTYVVLENVVGMVDGDLEYIYVCVLLDASLEITVF